MLSEQDKTFLGKIFLNYNFTMTTAQLNKEKLYYRDIQRMLDEGLIEKVKRGYYHWIEDYGTSEVAIINSLFPDAVFCMETALFYYKYSDRNPAEWNITVDKNTSRQRTNIDYPFVKAYQRCSLLARRTVLSSLQKFVYMTVTVLFAMSYEI